MPVQAGHWPWPWWGSASDCLFICTFFKASHEQVFRPCETATFWSLDFLMVSGPRHRSPRVRETSTFRKTRKSACSLGGASSLRNRHQPDSFRIPKKIGCANLWPNTFCISDARPRAPAKDYEYSDKSNPFGKVSSRAGETRAFEALENSSGGNCHLTFGFKQTPSFEHPRDRKLLPTSRYCPSSCRD